MKPGPYTSRGGPGSPTGDTPGKETREVLKDRQGAATKQTHSHAPVHVSETYIDEDLALFCNLSA